jgi:hypothetical protein
MNKIISFSLYGNKPNFQVGAVVNTIEAKRIYPDWRCRFYTTDNDTVCKQLEYLGAEVVRMDDWPDGNMFWRFLAVDDADICISRDADSVVNEREAGAVREWLEDSEYQWHGMHDNRAHRSVSLLGGMWGYRHFGINCPASLAEKGAYFFDFRTGKTMRSLIEDWLNQDDGRNRQTTGRGWDQLFLGDAIVSGKAETNTLWHGGCGWPCNGLCEGRAFPAHDPVRYGSHVGSYVFY